MKRIRLILLSFLLALTLTLTSCLYLPLLLLGGGGERQETVSFAELTYARPSVEEYTAQTEEAIGLIEKGCTLTKTVSLINNHSARYQTFLSMYNYAFIQTSLDTGNEFYREEIRFYDENNPVIMQYNELFWIAVANCKHFDSLQNLMGDDTLAQFKEFRMYSDPTFMELAKQEGAKITEYRELTAGATIEWNGEERLFSELEAEKLPDAEWRDAVEAYYAKYNPLCAALFLELNDIRSEMAKALGYDSYTEIAAYQLGRDFQLADCRDFIVGLREEILPLIRRVQKETPLPTSSPEDRTEEEILTLFDTLLASISQNYKDEADFMREFGLFDLKRDPKKEQLSYTVYLPDNYAPYLFVSPTGTEDDLMTLVHEFGHFYEMDCSADNTLNVDFSECFSQGMEMLALSHLHEVLDAETAERIRNAEMNNWLDIFLYQGLYADFEYRLYTENCPDTVEGLNLLFKETSKDWGFTSIPDSFYQSWIGIPHLFLYPTYVLSYCLSLDAALQIYEAEQTESGAGLALYESLVDQACKGADMAEALENVGMQSPLAEGRLKETSSFLETVFFGKEPAESTLAA